MIQVKQRPAVLLWNDAGVFQPKSDHSDADDDSPSYVIMMPPPNVTGTLHGTCLTITLQDILIRYHRMKGHNTLYLPELTMQVLLLKLL